VGGSTKAAARRAARHGLSFFPAVGDEALAAVYHAECERLGTAPGIVLVPEGPGFVHVADDPDRAWAEIGRYLLYEASVYASWQQAGQRSQVTDHATTVDELRAGNVYRILTPGECVALVEELGPSGAIVLHPLIGGLPPELSWPSLELVADRVLPALGRA
jgi:alkanesulfonate monooxygenase SsuD/methylene tetrahydromethanopterin reductase-like flavin-dependent oxidoreductase (luciferase family)